MLRENSLVVGIISSLWLEVPRNLWQVPAKPKRSGFNLNDLHHDTTASFVFQPSRQTVVAKFCRGVPPWAPLRLEIAQLRIKKGVPTEGHPYRIRPPPFVWTVETRSWQLYHDLNRLS